MQKISSKRHKIMRVLKVHFTYCNKRILTTIMEINVPLSKSLVKLVIKKKRNTTKHKRRRYSHSRKITKKQKIKLTPQESGSYHFLVSINHKRKQGAYDVIVRWENILILLKIY